MFSITTLGQSESSKKIFNHKLIQEAFNRIGHLPDSLLPANFVLKASGCDYFIEMHDFLEHQETFILDDKFVCAYSKAIIFQLNQSFFRIESLKSEADQLELVMSYNSNANEVLEKWNIVFDY